MKGLRFNPSHRKFAILVANTGRFLVVFGLILAEKEKAFIYGAAAIAVVSLILTMGYYRQISQKEEGAQRVPSG